MAHQKEWWHTNAEGQRIGYMDPDAFEALLAGYYGDRKWISGFAEDFNFSIPSVYKWRQGSNPIPKHVAMLVLLLAKVGGPQALPVIDAPWLPEDPKMAKPETKAA